MQKVLHTHTHTHTQADIGKLQRKRDDELHIQNRIIFEVRGKEGGAII
jgi:hypothetical protein